MKNITAIFMALILLVLPLAGCGAQEAPEAGGAFRRRDGFCAIRLRAAARGRAAGRSRSCCRPGSEAHSYEPTPKDIIDIQNCDLFIYVGRRVSDAWVADVLESVGEGVRAVTLMDCVELLEEEHGRGHGARRGRTGMTTGTRPSTTSTSGPARATPRSYARR